MTEEAPLPEKAPKEPDGKLKRLLDWIRRSEQHRLTEQTVQVQFSEETRQELERLGYTIIHLEGLNADGINEQYRDRGEVCLSSGQEHTGNYEEMLAIPSRATEVAVNLNDPFLSGTDNLTYREIPNALTRFSKGLGISGARAVLGSATDYLELAATHLNEKGEKIFDSEIATSTPIRRSNNKHKEILIANLDHSIGYRFTGPRTSVKVIYNSVNSDFSNNEIREGIRVLPLIVPA